MSSLKLEAFSDIDWAKDTSKQWSHSGFSIYFGCNLVSWQLKKQPTIACSTIEVEYRSLADATSEVLWIQKMLKELS